MAWNRKPPSLAQPLSLSARTPPSPPIFAVDDAGGRDLIVVKEQSGSCGDRGSVRIGLSLGSGERGLGRDNVRVEEGKRGGIRVGEGE